MCHNFSLNSAIFFFFGWIKHLKLCRAYKRECVCLCGWACTSLCASFPDDASHCWSLLQSALVIKRKTKQCEEPFNTVRCGSWGSDTSSAVQLLTLRSQSICCCVGKPYFLPEDIKFSGDYNAAICFYLNKMELVKSRKANIACDLRAIIIWLLWVDSFKGQLSALIRWARLINRASGTESKCGKKETLHSRPNTQKRCFFFLLQYDEINDQPQWVEFSGQDGVVLYLNITNTVSVAVWRCISFFSQLGRNQTGINSVKSKLLSNLW